MNKRSRSPRTTRPGEPADIAPAQQIQVLLAGKLTALDAPGGGEVQMLALARELPSVGVDGRPWRPWEESLDGADVLHLFGSLPEHLPLVEVARRRGVRVVLSTIAWFSLGAYARESGSLLRGLRASAGFLARAACPRLPSWRRRLYHAVDLLLPNSNAEARQLTRYFGVPARRIRIVPNGADPRFADAEPCAFAGRIGMRGFVLYAGRIEPRKNQLGFLRAMQGTQVPIVVLGDAVPGHASYLAACRRAAGPNVRFVRRIDHDDPLLGSAYAGCACLALASWYETPGLVALEAAMSGTPLVLPEGGSAREYFGGDALYVRPGDGLGIRRAVLAALDRSRNPELAERTRHCFSWKAAAEATRQAYQGLVQK